MFCKILMIVCGVAAVSVDAKAIKGIQIKNRGHERLCVEMTDEKDFELPAGQMASIVVEDTWTGRILAQAGECKGKHNNSPYTQAFFKFEQDDDDRYYVSLIDGFNRPIKIQPTSQDHSCKSTLCHANLNQHCPTAHQVKNGAGAVVGCKAAPDIFQKLCPMAIITEDDVASRTFTCRSNTYMVLLG